MKPGVIICQPVDETGASHQELAAAGCNVKIADPAASLAERLSSDHPVHALLGATFRPERLEAKWLASFPKLRIVSKYTIGFDDVDTDDATGMGILVTHSPTEANWGGVAEGTIALMLGLLKKTVARTRSVKSGAWRDDSLRGTYLGAREDGYPGITVGIVGFGRVGRRVADLLRPWKVRLLAADPYVDESEFRSRGVEPVKLDQLLAQSDVVSVHCTLTPETTGLMDRSRLAAMKPGAVLINTARGPIVDLDALSDVLDSGLLAGAALDVLPTEPPPAGSRILLMDDRVLLSPHMVAANQGGTLSAAIPMATAAVLTALRGVVPDHVCNPDVIPAWRERFGGVSLLNGA